MENKHKNDRMSHDKSQCSSEMKRHNNNPRNDMNNKRGNGDKKKQRQPSEESKW